MIYVLDFWSQSYEKLSAKQRNSYLFFAETENSNSFSLALSKNFAVNYGKVTNK